MMTDAKSKAIADMRTRAMKEDAANKAVPNQPINSSNPYNQMGGLWDASGVTHRPFGIGQVGDPTQNIYKAVIPRFLYKPPFGYPRFINIPEIRRLAASPFIEMCITAIIDQMAAMKWEIVPKDKDNFNEEHVKIVKSFFENPNINKENFAYILSKIDRDLLTIDSGVLVKVFNIKQEMSEMIVRDSATFTMNPDIFGMFTNRSEFILPGATNEMEEGEYNSFMKEKPAYFQYGWITGARPMPFGRREIVYMMKNPRPDSIYGQGPMETIMDVVQTLVYGVDYYLEYHIDNNIPKGVMQMIGATQPDIDAFTDKWAQVQKIQNKVGDWRKRWHRMPVVGFESKFMPIQFSASELELITQSKWFLKLVWAVYGVTGTEMGMDEHPARAHEITQSKVFKRRALRPLLKLVEYHINAEVIPEFETGVRFHSDHIFAGKLVKGIDDVKFQFDMYDIDEDMSRHNLWQTQLRNGIRTQNEIREDLGLEPVEGGDELKRVSAPPFQGGFGGFGNTEKVEEKAKKVPKSNRTIANMKVPSTYSDIKKSVIEMFNKQKNDIFKFIDMQGGEPTVMNIKSIEEHVDKIKGFISSESVRNTVMDTIRKTFSNAVNTQEIKFNRNFQPRANVIDFLQKSAFESIKGMTEELANKVSERVRRGVMEGWGVQKLKKAISEVFDKNESRAEMIARTEVIKAENKALYETYQQADIKADIEWIAKIDDRTCSRCRDLDGKTVELNKKFKTAAGPGWEGFHPTVHPRCRCVTALKPKE